jgi:hypothetical protein
MHYKEGSMKRMIMFAGVLVFVLTLLVVQDSIAQEKKKSAKKAAPNQEEMMKRWQESMTPGEAHKNLASMAGTWDAEVKTWMSGPTGEPMVSKATSECTVVLGGRFVEEKVTGEMMSQPFNGIGYTGYDNMKKKYVSVWMDNMGTMVMTMEGTADKGGATYTFWGKIDDPMTGAKNKKLKAVTRVIDNNKHVFEYYDVTSYGDKKPTMTITYTRKKS